MNQVVTRDAVPEHYTQKYVKNDLGLSLDSPKRITKFGKYPNNCDLVACAEGLSNQLLLQPEPGSELPNMFTTGGIDTIVKNLYLAW